MYGGEALSRALFVLLPHHRSVARPPLSLERPVGFAPPPCSGFAFLAAPRRQHIASAPYSCERESYVRQSTKRAPNFLELCARELRRIPLPRTPANTGKNEGPDAVRFTSDICVVRT